MAKASGGTRTKYPSKNGGTTGKGVEDFRFFAPPDSAMGKVGKEAFERLNADLTKILTDAGVDMGHAVFEVSSNEFEFRTDKFTLTRQFHPKLLTMEHEYFVIDDENARNKGVAKKAHYAMWPIYEKLGVQKLAVYAALENGGANWASYGFQVRRSTINNLINSQINEKFTERVKKVVDNFYSKNKSDAMFPMHLITDNKWGYDALTGTTWADYLDLTDKSQRDVFLKKIGRA